MLFRKQYRPTPALNLKDGKVVENWDLGLILWIGDDLGLPTGPRRLLKPFFDNVLFEHGGQPHVLFLAINLDLR